jgi:hypothetical protein
LSANDEETVHLLSFTPRAPLAMVPHAPYVDRPNITPLFLGDIIERRGLVIKLFS